MLCGSKAEVVLRPIFVTWLSRACIRTRGLISQNFSRPGLVYYVFCSSRAEVVLRPIFVTRLCQACIKTMGLISLNFSRPGVVYYVFCGSEVVLRPVFVTWLWRVCIRNQGLNFAKVFTPWSCLHCVLWLQSRSCFTAIFVTWLCRAFYLVMDTSLC